MKKILVLFLIFLSISIVSCQNPAPDSTTPSPELPDEIILHDDFMTKQGSVIKTWTKDYDCSEWKNNIPLNLYINFPVGEANQPDIQNIEDELNHYLYQSGYNFSITFHTAIPEDILSGKPVDSIVEHRESNGLSIDIYVTNDYISAIQNNRLLDCTEFILSHELYNKFDQSVWSQLLTKDKKYYGVPLHPIATSRMVYAYNPQMTSILNLDMSSFTGEVSDLEYIFPFLLEQNTIPLELNVREDYLMLSLFGLEVYDQIFVVNTDTNQPFVTDLFENANAMSYYKSLGALKEKGYLAYSYDTCFCLELDKTSVFEEMYSHNYTYRFLSLTNTAVSSFYYDVNGSVENTYLETNYWVPDTNCYIYQPMDSDIMVINATTNYPKECLQFLNLFFTDNTIRMLLYSGIEGEHYMIQEERCIFETAAFSAGLGLGDDRRFFPIKKYAQKYTDEISTMNSRVEYASLANETCDFFPLSSQYEACQSLFWENRLVFLGYYGAATEQKLNELHHKLIDAGYHELIDYINKNIH